MQHLQADIFRACMVLAPMGSLLGAKVQGAHRRVGGPKDHGGPVAPEVQEGVVHGPPVVHGGPVGCAGVSNVVQRFLRPRVQGLTLLCSNLL